jgi:tRNA(adenine34) deaminase
MCAGAIVLARIPIVVYGVSDPLRGGISAFNLLDQPNLNHKSQVVSGVLEHECRDMLQTFFKARRK